MASSGSIWVSLGLNTANFQKGLRGAKGQLTGFQKGMAGLKGMFNPFTIGVGIVAGLGAAFSNAVGIVTDFEKANSKLAAITKATASDMENLSDQAKNLGSITAFTASQVTELQTEFAKLGFPTGEILDMTEATLAGAAALGSELGEQAALVGATIKQYALDAKEAGRVNDVLALSASSSALDFQKLSTALPIVGATAAAAGVSLERTTALLGTLSDRGIDASTSGTALRNVFLKLSETGLTYDQAMHKINTSVDKNAAALDLFGTRGATVGVILASTGVTLEELELKLNNANGAAKLMADTMLDNLAGSTTKAKSAWEGFVLSLEDGNGVLSVTANNVTKLFTGILSSLTELNDNGFLAAIESQAMTLSKAFGIVDDSMTEIKTSMGNVVLSEEEMVKATRNNSTAVDEMKKRFKAGDITARQFQKGIEMLAGGYTRLTEAQRAMAASDEAVAKKKAALNKAQEGENAKIIAAEFAAIEAAKKAEEAAKKKADAIANMTDKQRENLAQIKALKEEYSTFERVQSISASNLKLSSTTYDEVNAKIKRLTESLGSMEIGSEASEKLKLEIEALKLSLEGQQLNIPIFPTLEPIPEEQMNVFTDQGAMMQGVADGMSQGITGAMGKMADGMVSSFGDTETAMGRFTQSLAKMAIEMIATHMAAAMASAIGGAVESGTSTGPAAVFSTPAFIASAIAGVIGAFASIPAFAMGGLVTGPTVGMVGEGKGTTASNPEVIAPLDKLKGFLGGENNGMGGEVRFVISGDNLMGILERKNKINKFSN